MKKSGYKPSKGNQSNNRARVSNFAPTHHKNERPKVNGGVFVYSKPLSVGELSKAIDVPATEIIKQLFLLGKMVTINQMLDDLRTCKHSVFSHMPDKEHGNVPGFCSQAERHAAGPHLIHRSGYG